MLSSKSINIIAICLIIAALVFAVFVLFMSNDQNGKITGETVYADGQTIYYDSGDYYNDYTQAKYSKIILNGDSIYSDSANVEISGANVTINSGGTYEITGTLSNGSITVDSKDSAAVRLILSGADIITQSAWAINIQQSEKTVISLAPGTVNSVISGQATDDLDVDAAIYSKDDLVINGEGNLHIDAGYADGIKSNDGLKIMSGNISVSAIDEAINANDFIGLKGGNISVVNCTDAIKCENNDDSVLGFIALEGGQLSINAADDGIYAGSDLYINDISADIFAGGDAVHAEKNLYLNGGTINISNCTEGLEGAYITVNGGDYTIVASDDGLNATGENSAGGITPGRHSGLSSEIYMTINGGTIHAQVGGDGLDSNAAAVINGGYIEVYGPENNGNSTLDFDGGFTVNGGTLICAGSSGMAESPTQASTQNTIVFTLDKTYNANTSFELKDSSGKVVLSGFSTKRFDWVCISSDEILTDETYTLYVDDSNEASVTVTSVITSTSKRQTFDGRAGMHGMR